jgi:hypothetical protein
VREAEGGAAGGARGRAGSVGAAAARRPAGGTAMT